MQNKRLLTLLILLFFFTAGHLLTNTAHSQEKKTSAMPAITPEAQQAIQSELQKSGIQLTPAEIQKGKELLEQQEKTKAPTSKTDKKEIVPQEPEVKSADKKQPKRRRRTPFSPGHGKSANIRMFPFS